MKKLRQLLAAARALTPQVTVTFRGSPAADDEWVCIVAVGAAIIFESKPGSLDFAIDEAGKKLKGMSQKMKAVLEAQTAEETSPITPRKSKPPPPSGST